MHHDHEERPEGICDDCGNFCRAVLEDIGIGPYEFWGSKGCHRDFQPVSPCCGAEVVPGGSKLLDSAVRTARKTHMDKRGRQIEPGDTYRQSVYYNYRQGGAGWITTEKTLVRRRNTEGTSDVHGQANLQPAMPEDG